MHSNVKRITWSLLAACAGAAFLFTHIASADVTGTLLPTSDGNYSLWTPKSGATHYTHVSEASCDGTTTYVSTSGVGNRDSYAVSLAGIPDGSTITAIQITPCASRNSNGGGSATLNVFYRFNGVNSSDLGAYALTGTTPSQLSATSFSSLSLTKSGGSTLEVGAVYSAGTKGARVSRLATVITYTQPAPVDPSNLVATPSSTTAVLTWTDNSNNESGFKVERSLDNVNFSQIATTSANATSYVNTGLVNNQTYYYKVRAYNANGNSGYTNVASVQLPTLLDPSDLQVTSGSTTTATLTWTDNATNEVGYKIERSTDGVNFSQINTVSANITTYKDPGRAQGATYYYRVRAYNAGGNSGYTNIAQVTIQYLNQPTAPSSLFATPSSTTAVTLLWTDNSNNEQQFDVERSDDNVNFAVIATRSANTNWYTDTTVLSGQTYYYRVNASNVVGASGYTNTAQVDMP